MKYKVAVLGFLLFLIGFLLASKAYDFICGCISTNPPIYAIPEYDPCYQCLLSSKYQNLIIIFQIIMILSVFIILYGFFSEFEYSTK